MTRPDFPSRLRQSEEGLEARAGKLLDSSRGLPRLTPARHEALFRRVAARTSRASGVSLGLALAAATCAALTIGLSSLLLESPRHGAVVQAPPEPLRVAGSGPTPEVSRPAPGVPAVGAPASDRWERRTLASIGTLELSPDAVPGFEVRELEGARQLRLEAGALRARIDRQVASRPVVVVTPHLRVVVIGTRFNVTVDREQQVSAVELYEGHVRVETVAAVVLLDPGESIRSDDPRLRPAAPKLGPAEHVTDAVAASTARTVAACGRQRAPAARKACYARFASSGGLSAENALYELGMLARESEHDHAQALKHWRSYQQRFPDGALAPEVALAVFETLLVDGPGHDAVAAAAEFERRFPGDPRAAEVALARARLLCADAATRRAGALLLAELAARPDSALSARALDAKAACAGPAPPGPGAGDRPPDGGAPAE